MASFVRCDRCGAEAAAARGISGAHPRAGSPCTQEGRSVAPDGGSQTQLQEDRPAPTRDKHFCHPPRIGSLSMPMQPDWTCAECGRIWRDCASSYWRWWAEVRGPDA